MKNNKLLPLLAALLLFAGITCAQQNEVEKVIDLSLATALSMMIENNPEIAGYRLRVPAMKYMAEQKRKYPNPEIEAEAENFLGSGEFSGLDGSEVTFAVSQTVPLTSRLSRSYETGIAESQILESEVDELIASKIADLKKNYFGALAVREKIKMNKELIELAGEFSETLAKRINAGKLAESELGRAEVAASILSLENDELLTEYETILNRIKALLAIDNDTGINLTGKLRPIVVLPRKETLLQGLQEHPALKTANLQIEKSKNETELQKVSAIPDLNIRAGIKRDNGSGSEAFILGAGIPLPLFDKNKGNIEAAKINEKIGIEGLRNTMNQLTSRLDILYRRAVSLQERFITVKEKILPKTGEVYKKINEGNRQGRYSVLDVLDSRRSLYEARSRYTGYLGELYSVIVELEMLTSTEIIKESK